MVCSLTPASPLNPCPPFSCSPSVPLAASCSQSGQGPLLCVFMLLSPLARSVCGPGLLVPTASHHSKTYFSEIIFGFCHHSFLTQVYVGNFQWHLLILLVQWIFFLKLSLTEYLVYTKYWVLFHNNLSQ